jgi:DNA-binding response OmpR family regulator
VHEAVEVAGQQEFDLLISDIGLPDGSGMDILSRIDRSKPMHAIALSGFGQEDDLVRSRDAGFEAHLTKPINFQALRETVSRYAAASD